MLSSGAAAAVPSSACLRCQLRSVLQHLRCPQLAHRRRLAPRHYFSIVHRQRAANVDGIYYKRISPGGRIIGKPGRKQRQTSEPLAISSLGEKSEIVIFRDVLEGRNSKVAKSKESKKDADFGEEGLKGLSLTPAEIRAALSETDQAPDEEEVNASIDALQPQAPVLEQQEFDRLVQELLKSYNVRQLSRYLRRSLSSKQSLLVHRSLEYSIPGNVRKSVTFTRSRWQPGRTPLEKRRISEISSPEGTSSTPKARAAERILRVAWQVGIDSEEKQLGEIEMEMRPWQLSILFDVLSPNGQKPKFESLIHPPMLLRNAEVRPHRPDGIVRITARRQDAEDIASQLENGILRIGKLVLNLSGLSDQSQGSAGAVKSLKSFRKEDLDLISQRTQSVLIQESNGKVGIYSFYPAERQNARRLLLALLDLPSQKIRSQTMPAEAYQEDKHAESAKEPLALVPVFPGDGLHFRHRLTSFTRATLPLKRKSSTAKEASVPPAKPAAYTQTRAADMSWALGSLVQTDDGIKRGFERSSFWGTMKHNPLAITNKYWTVQLGKLLQRVEQSAGGNLTKEAKKTSGDADKNVNNHVLLKQVPGFEALLSYFRPKKGKQQSQSDTEQAGDFRGVQTNVARSSSLVAHFMPSPFTFRGVEALTMFPRLELSFSRSSGDKISGKDLKVESLRAVLHEEVLDIPLPDQSIDLRLHRQSDFFAPKESLYFDPEIIKFSRVLNNSARENRSLQGESEVEFRIPSAVTHDRSIDDRSISEFENRDIPVPYLFDRFEQTQTTFFFPNMEALSMRAEHNSAIENLVNSLPEGTYLRYKEVEAGTVGGRYTDISIGFRPAEGSPPKEQLPPKPSIRQEYERNVDVLEYFLKPALAVADVLTRVCKAEIRDWRPQVLEEGMPSSIHLDEDEISLENPQSEDTSVLEKPEPVHVSEDGLPASAAESQEGVERENHETVQAPDDEVPFDDSELEERSVPDKPEHVQPEDELSIEESDSYKADSKL